ncbi:hypothetical protein D3C86_2067990 [compost metagenome]
MVVLVMVFPRERGNQYAENQIVLMLFSDQGEDRRPEGVDSRAEMPGNLIRQLASDEVATARVTWRTPALPA